MNRPQTIDALLATGAAEAPAIGAPGRPALSFGALRDHVGATVSALNAMGIGRGDRVAIVLDNGSTRAVDVESLALRAEEVFGFDRVVRASTLPDALEVATALVEDGSEGYSGSGIVVTGSVVTAGAARTLFGKDPLLAPRPRPSTRRRIHGRASAA